MVLKRHIVHKLCVLNMRTCSTTASDTCKLAHDKQSDQLSNIEKIISTETETKLRKTINPNETSVVFFPGQGTQYVGMTKKLLRFPQARDIFELANDVLKFDLLKIMLEGPREELDRTVHAQPAVFVASLAALEQLREERPQVIDSCVATAGFSLGEITALTFAGAMSLRNALKLVQVRAIAMQQACDSVESGMALVLYGPDTNLSEACAKSTQWCTDLGIESPYCNVANYMYPHCKILAGHLKALEFLETNMRALKIKRIKRLSVNGAFHTPLMQSAIEPFSRALNSMLVTDPIIRVYSNVNGRPYKNGIHVKRQLPKQILQPVKWEQTMHEMFEREHGMNFPRIFECGPGTGLLQILGKVNAKAANKAYNIQA